MPNLSELLPDLRFSDVKTFLAVRRCGSITGAARELRVTPSQVSKAVSRLEAQLHRQLLVRSAKGVTLSESALQITSHLEEVVVRLQQVALQEADVAPKLTVAGPSYLLMGFLPGIAAAQPNLRIRGLQLAPALIRSFSTQTPFELSLTHDVQRLPPHWTSERAGDVRKGLFSTPEVARALGSGAVSPEVLREVPFVVPMYLHNDQQAPIEDGCPMPLSERRLGHEVQTISLGLRLAAATHQLVFGPLVAAQSFLEEGSLVEIHVQGWKVADPLHVACDADRVTAKVFKAVLAAVQGSLAEVTPRSAA